MGKTRKCPWCKITMHDVPLNQFYHRRGLKAQKCSACGFLALIDPTQVQISTVNVGGRVVEESTSFVGAK